MDYINVIPLEIHEGMSERDSCVLMVLEPTSQKAVPIVISYSEVQALLATLQSATAKIPGPYNLTNNIMRQFMLETKEARIDNLIDGVFKASIVVGDGFNQHTIACRVGDAVVMSAMTECPLMMNMRVLQDAGCPANSLIDNLPKRTPEAVQQQTLQQLLEEQRECEESEDYERAAELQRQIERLQNGGQGGNI